MLNGLKQNQIETNNLKTNRMKYIKQELKDIIKFIKDDKHSKDDQSKDYLSDGEVLDIVTNKLNELVQTSTHEVMWKKEKRYKVQFNYVYGWDDVFFVDGINTNEEPTLFKSKKEAEECIEEHMKDLKNAIADGNMSTDSIQERDDYRIVEFKNK